MTFQTDPDIAAFFATLPPMPEELFDESVPLQRKVDLLREGSRRDSRPTALALSDRGWRAMPLIRLQAP